MKHHSFLITDKSNIRYLSNFTGSSGFMLIINGKSGKSGKKYLFTDFRYIEHAQKTIKKGIEIVDIAKMWRNKADLKKNWQNLLKSHSIKNLGVEEGELTVSRYKRFKKISPKVKFKDISGHFEEIREIKTKEEIALITKSQRINEKVFLEIEKIIKNHNFSRPLTEIEIAWKIKELGFKESSEEVSFDPIVSFGKNSSIVHHSPTKAKLQKNDIVLIDMGMKYHGYCSDMTRMILPKNAPPFMREIYDLVLKAQMAGINAIKAGTTGAKADSLSRKIIEKSGYGEQYGHSGGHGIGLDIHEIPSLAESYKKPLRENSIITVEPGIYLPGKFGVRIEDMVLVTKKGNICLTRVDK
ncbi:aminopeptidase P family protein [Candidatus Peregrinibacteria bacterium]|nr:aminopeptidase P family protein [Candidatus Peregrinibacteria bacterium]